MKRKDFTSVACGLAAIVVLAVGGAQLEAVSGGTTSQAVPKRMGNETARPAVEISRPEVEVVFCLDTTGSMSGLIEGAKHKIWSIANQIVSGKPTPDLRVGLVAYRDYDDEYVVKVHQLDSDLDAVYEHLQSFRADGGGDTPEHVNRALHAAVKEIAWSGDPRTLRLVFLVGDCPPHMDYRDGYDYRAICKEAIERDIIINTIQCGGYEETIAFWKDIARLAEGNYAAIAQDGGMQVVETPFDVELASLSAKLEDTFVPYGVSVASHSSRAKKAAIRDMAPAAAAERAAYKSSGAGMGSSDLIGALKSGEVKLEELRDAELPAEMRGMSLKEKKEYLMKQDKARAELTDEMEKLSGERKAYLAKKLAESARRAEGLEDSFDKVVGEFIAAQASEKGIRY